jgi:preprotein translocase subunit YajC
MPQFVGPLVFFCVALAIYYVVFIFPQQKQARERQAVIKSIEPGDEVVTYGGIFGFVKKVEENWVILTIAKGVDIKAAKEAVVMRRQAENQAEKQTETAQGE